MIHYQMTVSYFNARPQRKMHEAKRCREKKITSWFVTFLLFNVTDKNNYFNDVYI